jgi:hypothetical protein
VIVGITGTIGTPFARSRPGKVFCPANISLGFEVADELTVPLLLTRVTDQLYQGARCRR